jgi:hypothetical protein
MPEANSISVASNPVSRYPGHVRWAVAKPISLHNTIVIYTHVLNPGPAGVRSPVDVL